MAGKPEVIKIGPAKRPAAGRSKPPVQSESDRGAEIVLGAPEAAGSVH